jgi:hypothetical protein
LGQTSGQPAQEQLAKSRAAEIATTKLSLDMPFDIESLHLLLAASP